MYLHLGQDTVVRKKDIIGIFDMDTTTVSKISRDFLNTAEKNKNTVNVSYELPKSFIVVKENGCQKIYISQLSSQTLEKRANSSKIFYE